MSKDKPAYKPLAEVAESIKKDGVIIYPTDTIYGLGCDIFSRKGVERIARIKKRDPQKPFSFVCSSMEQIGTLAFVPTWAFRLMKKSLPGPYTFILEARKSGIPKKAMGKRTTVGVRIPDSEICQKLLSLVDNPIVSTSVNLAGGEPVSDLSELSPDFTKDVDIAISIGSLLSNPSTIIDLTGDAPVIIRQGKGEPI